MDRFWCADNRNAVHGLRTDFKHRDDSGGSGDSLERGTRVERSLEPKTKAVDKVRFAHMREDAATLREIESLYDHGIRGEELGDAVEAIIKDMRA